VLWRSSSRLLCRCRRGEEATRGQCAMDCILRRELERPSPFQRRRGFVRSPQRCAAKCYVLNYTPTAAPSTQLTVSPLLAAASSSVSVKLTHAISSHCCARSPAGHPGTERRRHVGCVCCRSGQRWALAQAMTVIKIARVDMVRVPKMRHTRFLKD